jgi:hypothetical protein
MLSTYLASMVCLLTTANQNSAAFIRRVITEALKMFYAWMRSDWESTERGQKNVLPLKSVLTKLTRAKKKKISEEHYHSSESNFAWYSADVISRRLLFTILVLCPSTNVNSSCLVDL